MIKNRECRKKDTKVFCGALFLPIGGHYEQEKNLVRLADILGHSNINTTRIYTMESGRNHMRQLEKLEVLFDFYNKFSLLL